MGGVYYDVPRNMNYDDPYQDLHPPDEGLPGFSVAAT